VQISSTRSSFLDVVFSARAAFSKRSWPYVAAIVLPWLLLCGQRCVTRLAALSSRRRSLSAYYRFLSEGKWRLPVLFHALFSLLRTTFPAPTLTLVVDDTLVPKVGRGIFGTGYHYDSHAPRPGALWGHNWVVLAMVVQAGPVGWIALPFWVSLYRAKKSCPPVEFRTRTQLALEALSAVRTWFSGRIELLADGAYNHNRLAAPLEELGILLVSRLRYDARLRELLPPPRKGRRGRKPTHGARFTPQERLAQRSKFSPLTVQIYGREVTLLVQEFEAFWVTAKKAIKVVITLDPLHPRRFAYLSTTDLSLSASQVIELFSRRWSIEQLFSVCKNQLGFDSAEVRTERSVKRHAALTMALTSWTEVWARRHRPRLSASSFAHKLSAVREETFVSLVLARGPRTRRNDRIARSLAGVFSVATRAA
jgi:hypothetical protein